MRGDQAQPARTRRRSALASVAAAPEPAPIAITAGLHGVQINATAAQLMAAGYCNLEEIPQGRKTVAYSTRPDGVHVRVNRRKGGRWDVFLRYAPEGASPQADRLRALWQAQQRLQDMPASPEQWKAKWLEIWLDMLRCGRPKPTACGIRIPAEDAAQIDALLARIESVLINTRPVLDVGVRQAFIHANSLNPCAPAPNPPARRTHLSLVPRTPPPDCTDHGAQA